MSSSTPKPKRTCSVKGCERPHRNSGLCNKHRQRVRHHGDTGLTRKRPKLEDSRSKHKAKRSPRTIENAKEARRQRYESAKLAATLRLETARVFTPLLGDERYKGAKGGRGSGKSHFFAETLVEMGVSNPDLRAVCIREVQLSLRQSVKRLIEDKIEKLKAQRHFKILKTEIRILDRNGRERGIIIFQGMQNHTADSIKSLEGFDIAWVEEAQSLSEHSFSLLRPTIRKAGSQLWFSWNPRSPKDPVDKFFASKPPNSAVVTANWQHNPWFPDVLRQDMEYDRERDRDRYLHVWEGHYQHQTQSRVFRNWKVGTPQDFANPYFLKLIPRYGADWGYAKDPTVGIKLRIDERARKLYFEREVWQIGCDIAATPALFDKLDGGEMRKWPSIADSARPETIAHMNKNGYPKMRAAKKGKGSVVEGVEFLKSYDIIVHPDLVHTIDELSFYSYEVDKHTEEILPEFADEKNHLIDAARYAAESVRHSKKAGVIQL